MVDSEDTQSKSTKQIADPLLDCLEILSKFKRRTMSRMSAVAGLPLVNGRLTPSLFIRAAERVGFSARLFKKSLNQIPHLVLPAVLILKNNEACVLKSVTQDGQATIVVPETGMGETNIAIDELEKDYTGYVIFAQPIAEFEDTSKKYKDYYGTGKTKSWFWGTLARFKKVYTNVALAALAVNLFALAVPLFVMNVYDRVVPNNAFATLWVLAVGITIVFIFDFIMRMLRSYLLDFAGRKVDIILSSQLFSHVMGIQMVKKPESAGAFANNLRDFESLREFFTSATLVSIVDIPFIFIFVIVIAFIGGSMAVIPAVAIPIIMVFTYFFEKPMRRATHEAMMSANQKQAILVESIRNLETIKTNSSEGQMQGRWERFVGHVARAAAKSRFFSSLAIHCTLIIQQLTTMVTVVYGVYLIAAGQLTLGGLIACMILTSRSVAPLAQVTNLMTRLSHSRNALKNLDDIMAMPVERPPESRFLRRPVFLGNFEFDHVSFQYPGQEILALNDVSFKINSGEKVALIGPIGSGKSTALKLMLKLYTPTKGNIRFDGIDMGQIDPVDLRRNIGYTGQDYPLFHGTVLNNILMGTMCDTKDVLRAARISGVERFISKHPSGYNLVIGEGGEGVSGGQRQSICLARALVADPPILLLDEPTSVMEQSAQQALLSAMPDVLKGKTLVLITHRTPLLALVDRLIVFDNGKIVADGPKEKVLAALAKTGQVMGEGETGQEEQQLF